LDRDVVSRAGWLTWYIGEVAPPRPGRYRFWGYADNNLLVAIDGKPVFDGSRDGSAFREFRELDQLREHMEEKLIGSFSVSTDAVWKVKE
jgi:hypothetical protein